MNILFVCKYNRFRSKVAEAIFRKLDSKNEVKSAGIQIDLMRQYVAENVKKVMKNKGYEITDEKSRIVNDFDLKWADKIVIVASNVDKNMFNGKTDAEIEVWKIPDAGEKDKEKVKKIIGEIEARVRKLVAR